MWLVYLYVVCITSNQDDVRYNNLLGCFESLIVAFFTQAHNYWEALLDSKNMVGNVH